jgi:hypothetical protein
VQGERGKHRYEPFVMLENAFCDILGIVLTHGLGVCATERVFVSGAYATLTKHLQIGFYTVHSKYGSIVPGAQ